MTLTYSRACLTVDEKLFDATGSDIYLPYEFHMLMTTCEIRAQHEYRKAQVNACFDSLLMSAAWYAKAAMFARDPMNAAELSYLHHKALSMFNRRELPSE